VREKLQSLRSKILKEDSKQRTTDDASKKIALAVKVSDERK